MSRELTGAETLMGFLAWLTSRETPVTFSSRHNATLAIELLDAFSKVNNIGIIGPDWPEGLTHPEPLMTTNAEHESFETQLSRLINHHNLESASDTPDFLLARYLTHCLTIYNTAIVDREVWYGVEETKSRHPSVMNRQGAPHDPETVSRYICEVSTDRERRYLSEWHVTEADARRAEEAHLAKGCWQTVRLMPQETVPGVSVTGKQVLAVGGRMRRRKQPGRQS